MEVSDVDMLLNAAFGVAGIVAGKSWTNVSVQEVLSYGIIYTQICNVANRFLALKPTIKECYSKDKNTWINYHSTLSFIVYSVSCLFRHFFVFVLYFKCIIPTWQYTCIIIVMLLAFFK